MDRDEEIMLMRLLHDELPADQADDWRGRLETDPALRARYEALAGVWQALDDWTVTEPLSVSAEWRTSLSRRLAREAGVPIRLSGAPMWVRLAATAALAGGVMLGIGVGRLDSADEDPQWAFGASASLAEGFWLEAARERESGNDGGTP